MVQLYMYGLDNLRQAHVHGAMHVLDRLGQVHLHAQIQLSKPYKHSRFTPVARIGAERYAYQGF